MVKAEQTLEEINSLLFGGEEPEERQAEPRLLKQRGLSTDAEELESVPYYKKPTVQFLALLAVVIPFVWGLFSAFSSGESNQQASAKPEDRENQLLKESLEQERKKNQDLKIENGLKAQQMEVVPVTTPPAPKPVPKTIPQTAAKPVPKAVSIPPPPRVAPSPAPSRRVSYTPPPVKPAPIPTPRIEKPKVDPMEQWQALAALGNYGSISTEENSRATSQSPPSSEEIVVSSNNLKGSLTKSESATKSEPDSPEGGAEIFIGTEAKAELETPIAWAGRIQSQNRNFLIKLAEPLKGADGAEVIPAGAYLIATITEADDAGLVQMEITKVRLADEGGRIVEKDVPPGSLVVFGEEGNILSAEAQNSDSLDDDILASLLNGVASATNLVNRPTSQSFSNFGSSTSYGDSDPLAGFVEGATDSLAQSLVRQNRRGTARSMPTVFVLDRGTELQIYVNQSFSL